ncbi:MAG TPA: DUF929 family protein [bacterium]|nr:DUF929 family protein [bacterium]
MWLLPTLGVALALVIVGAVVHQRQLQSASRSALAAADGTPLPADIAHNLAAIPEGTWDRVGAGAAARPMLVGRPPSGNVVPVVLYVGAEYCPYCAVMRWPLVAALERFGTLPGVALSTSSATDVFPSTPTLTMLHQRYQSAYLVLQTVELQGNAEDGSGQYPPLQRLTAKQATLFSHYDPSGSIPFLLIGGQYLLSGAPFSPAVLEGMDWHAIAAALPLGTTAAARAILSTANEITAAICAVDGKAPASVCESAGVRDAAQTLPRAGN